MRVSSCLSTIGQIAIFGGKATYKTLNFLLKVMSLPFQPGLLIAKSMTRKWRQHNKNQNTEEVAQPPKNQPSVPFDPALQYYASLSKKKPTTPKGSLDHLDFQSYFNA